MTVIVPPEPFTAAEYARSHPACVIIVSGGNNTARFPDEASVMRGILIADGIDEARIIMEDRAANTQENFRYSAMLTDPERPVIVVTDMTHMRRAVRQAKRAGFRQVLRLPSPPDPAAFAADLMWEIIVELNYIVNGE